MLSLKALKFIYFFIFIFLYLPSFVIYVIPGTYSQLPIGGILSAIFLLILLFTKYKFSNKHIVSLCKIKVFQLYAIFLIYIFLAMFIHILLGKYSMSVVAHYAVKVGRFLLLAIPTFLLPTLAPAFGIRFKTMIKGFYSAIYIIFILGIIQYIAMIFNISFINYIFDFLTNSRSVSIATQVGDSVYIKARVFTIFSEPSALCQFIFLTMPFTFNLTFSKYRLFNHTYLNILFKKTILPLSLMILILTQSPIYLIFCFSELIILFIFKNIYYIKKYIFPILLFLSCVLLGFVSFIVSNFDLIEDTYLYRIYKVILSFGDYDMLVKMEPLLASRLTSYYNQVRVFLDNILFGVGFQNIGVKIIPYMLNTKLPLTEEYLLFLNSNAKMWGQNPSIVYTSLAELGIVGLSIYAYFIYSMHKILNKMKYQVPGIQSIFVGSFAQLLVAMAVISFYNYSFDCNPFMYFGFILMIILYYKEFSSKVEK